MEVTYIESNKTWVISYDEFNKQDNADKLAKQLEQFEKELKGLKELLKYTDEHTKSCWKNWGSDKPETVIPLNSEALGCLGKEAIPTVYCSQIAPINPCNGDLWYHNEVRDLGHCTSEIRIILNRWNGWMWKLIDQNNDHA